MCAKYMSAGDMGGPRGQGKILRHELAHLDAAKSIRLGLRFYDVEVRPVAV